MNHLGKGWDKHQVRWTGPGNWAGNEGWLKKHQHAYSNVGMVLHLLRKKQRSAFYFHQQRVFWDSRRNTESESLLSTGKNTMPPLGVIGGWEESLPIALIPFPSCSTSAEKQIMFGFEEDQSDFVCAEALPTGLWASLGNQHRPGSRSSGFSRKLTWLSPCLSPQPGKRQPHSPANCKGNCSERLQKDSKIINSS